MKKTTELYRIAKDKAIWIVAALIIGFFVYQTFLGGRVDLPRGGTARKTTVTVSGEDESETTKQIMITDGQKHSIPLSEIMSGGPPKDGIPSIDNPKFTTLQEASTWLTGDRELGIALSIEGTDRFYPYRILVSHEIVNDTIKGKRVLVTYCPLCFTGIVFNPVVDGEQVEFGVSGKLWNSNLLMYDRKSDSLWSQITGEAVVGEATGHKLKVLPSDIMTFDMWKRQHGDGQVLSRDTGFFRSYDAIPYGGDLERIRPFFPLNNTDSRLDENAFILGVVVGDVAKAYHFDAVKAAGEFEDEIGGQTLVVQYDKSTDSVRIFEKTKSGSLERTETFPSFWFSWVAVHPETEVYK